MAYLQTRFVKGEEGTLKNAVTECLNLSAEGKRNPRHPRIPSMLALSRETRERIADCVPRRDLFLDLEQAICRINALQSEVEALRDLETEGPMDEERARGLREAAREPTEVDRHNPFEGALWGEADQISRIKERYENRIEEMRSRNLSSRPKRKPERRRRHERAPRKRKRSLRRRVICWQP